MLAVGDNINIDDGDGVAHVERDVYVRGDCPLDAEHDDDNDGDDDGIGIGGVIVFNGDGVVILFVEMATVFDADDVSLFKSRSTLTLLTRQS